MRKVKPRVPGGFERNAVQFQSSLVVVVVVVVVVFVVVRHR